MRAPRATRLVGWLAVLVPFAVFVVSGQVSPEARNALAVALLGAAVVAYRHVRQPTRTPDPEDHLLPRGRGPRQGAG